MLPTGDGQAGTMAEWARRLPELDKLFPLSLLTELPRDGPFVSVIVEPREHAFLPFVLKNVAYYLRHWPMVLLHSEANRAWLDSWLPANHAVQLIPFTKGNISVADYSQLLCRATFWDQLPGERVLIFQTDTMIRRSGIARFIDYDYIGAPWPHATGYPVRHPVGNGGFSLRSRARCSAACSSGRAFAANKAPPEDVFFSVELQRLGHHVADAQTAGLFSSELRFRADSMAVHKPACQRAEWPALFQLQLQPSLPYRLVIDAATYTFRDASHTTAEHATVDARRHLQALVQEDRLSLPRSLSLARLLLPLPNAASVRGQLTLTWSKHDRTTHARQAATNTLECVDHHLAQDYQIPV